MEPLRFKRQPVNLECNLIFNAYRNLSNFAAPNKEKPVEPPLKIQNSVNKPKMKKSSTFSGIGSKLASIPEEFETLNKNKHIGQFKQSDKMMLGKFVSMENLSMKNATSSFHSNDSFYGDLQYLFKEKFVEFIGTLSVLGVIGEKIPVFTKRKYEKIFKKLGDCELQLVFPNKSFPHLCNGLLGFCDGQVVLYHFFTSDMLFREDKKNKNIVRWSGMTTDAFMIKDFYAVFKDDEKAAIFDVNEKINKFYNSLSKINFAESNFLFRDSCCLIKRTEGNSDTNIIGNVEFYEKENIYKIMFKDSDQKVAFERFITANTDFQLNKKGQVELNSYDKNGKTEVFLFDFFVQNSSKKFYEEISKAILKYYDI